MSHDSDRRGGDRTLSSHEPILGICGYSGSGKTTLIEGLMPLLIRDGLAVAVIKHDAHGLDVDRQGKDTDRFFRAGATVFAHDASQGFIRFPASQRRPVMEIASTLLKNHDLVIVEGHKETPLPHKIWLHSASGDDTPPVSAQCHARLAWTDDRVGVTHQFLTAWLRDAQSRVRLRAGILLDGWEAASAQAVSPTETELQWVVEALRPMMDSVSLVGNGMLPSSLRSYNLLVGAPDLLPSLAGIGAAMRWDPGADWIFVDARAWGLSREAVDRLLRHRVPGRWATVTYDQRTGTMDPVLAWFDRRMLAVLSQADSLADVVGHPKALTVRID